MESPLLPIALVVAIVGIAFTAVGTIYRWQGGYRVASTFWVAHFIALLGTVLAQGYGVGRFPLSTRSEYLLVLAAAVSALHLYVWFRLKVHVAGLVIPPVSALASALAWNLLSAQETSDAARTAPGWFLFHTTVSTLGIATLCLAFAMSVLYLVQDRALKSHQRLTLLERFPALDKCDQVGFHSMMIGFTLLTIGIATGVVVNSSVHERLWSPGFKQYMAALTWLVFAALIFSRRMFGFRGRKSAYLTIAGFVLGMATVLGMTI